MRTRSERRRFKYKPRSKEAVKRRANQTGGMFDSLVKSEIAVLSVKEGDHRFRVLPPTWDDAEDFGLEVWIHFAVGPDNQKYICPRRMKDEPCPICEERERAEKDGDTEYAKNLSPSKRVFAWAVDRDEEDAGPQIWNMPWSMDRDLNRLSVDKRSGEVLCIDDPEEGYDVEYTTVGKGIKTKYSGIQIGRKPCPLSDDAEQQQAWIDFAMENPVPEMLQYHDYDYIEKVFTATKKDEDEDEDDEEEEDHPRKRRSARDEDDQEEDRPRKRRSKDDDEDEEEEEEPPKRRRIRDEEDDEEDDEEEEEEEEAPKRRPRYSDAGKSKRKSKDDDEDEDEEEEDDDENPPVRRRSSSSAGRASTAGKSAATARRSKRDGPDDVRSPYPEEQDDEDDDNRSSYRSRAKAKLAKARR